MEIIHLILGKANPERMNGVNKVVHEMATNQVANGYPVQVWGITAHPEHDYPERIFTTRLFRAYRNPFHIDPSLKTAFLGYKSRIVVHIHGAFIPAFYSISRFLHKNNIPFIITPHSTYNKVMMKKNAIRKKLYFRFFEKRLLDRSFSIHLLGKSEWRGLGDIYHNEKSVILPYGFTRMEIKNPPDKAVRFSVVYCGRLAIYPKGLDILVKGFALFNQLHRDAQLILIGDGKDKAHLRELCRQLNIDASVTFTGSVFGKNKIRLLRECHVFAHPSRTDGIPATIVEAASLGLPCVISDETNMGERVDRFDAGYTMKSLDELEFARGLSMINDRIMINGEGPALEANAFSMIDADFNWPTILRHFNNIYHKALLSTTINWKRITQLQPRRLF
jgi:glycosyltransferase involved in cell wall biosynthesis